MNMGRAAPAGKSARPARKVSVVDIGIAVEGAELDGLGHMAGGDVLFPGQVGNGAGHLQDAAHGLHLALNVDAVEDYVTLYLSKNRLFEKQNNYHSSDYIY